MNTKQNARIAELQTRVAFSAFYVANKMNALEHRITERKALHSRQASLAAFGVDSSVESCIRAHLAKGLRQPCPMGCAASPDPLTREIARVTAHDPCIVLGCSHEYGHTGQHDH
jgi:hypothetical protein